jgi:hypothetical protein
MAKYRIKHIPRVGYFAQVKLGIFRRWSTIGRHPGGQFGEYPENHTDYPLNGQVDAVNLCQDYAKWKCINYGFVSYRDIPL